MGARAGRRSGGAQARAGVVFAVRRVVADYLSPARFDDVLGVATWPERATPARLVLRQQVVRDTRLLLDAQVTLVCLTAAGRVGRFPAALRARVDDSGTDHG